MGMHSVNITLPWTIGVFMVRNFMGISKIENPVPGSPSMLSEMAGVGREPGNETTVPIVPSTSADFIGSENLLGGNKSSEWQQQEVPPEVHADWSKLEAHVGYQAGILSSAFSIAQVHLSHSTCVTVTSMPCEYYVHMCGL